MQFSANFNATFMTRTCGRSQLHSTASTLPSEGTQRCVEETMRLLGRLPPALGIPRNLATRQMRSRNAGTGRTIAPPGGPKYNSTALLSHQQHSVFQEDAQADPCWQSQDFWWHAGLALG